jgi:hypothetical protein
MVRRGPSGSRFSTKLPPDTAYLTAIVLLSLQGSLVSSAVVSLIGVGCLAYYFAPPIYSFRFDDPFNGTRAAGIISRIRLLFNKGAGVESRRSGWHPLVETGSFVRRLERRDV